MPTAGAAADATTSGSADARPPVVRVMVDSPLPQLDRLFDYAVPEALRDTCVPGVRVRVPLRSAGRVADGYVVEVGDGGGYDGALSEVEQVVSALPVLRPEIWTLAREVADRQAGTASDVIRLAVPPRQVRVEKAHLAALAAVADADAASPADPAAPVVDPAALPVIDGYAPGTLDAAVDGSGRVAVDAIPEVVELPGGLWAGRWAVTLAQAAARVLASGRSSVLVVPDYRDQDQLEAALAAHAPTGSVLRTDARQSGPDRYRSFLAGLGDVPRIVVGNRSAVYAPAPSLGLVAMWDEGDPLHAEPLSPYAHARDVALLRSRQQGTALVLLAHSRSTEVERLVAIGYLTSVAPATNRTPRVIPTTSQTGDEGFARQARIPSGAWRAAKDAVEHGPVLIQVARPGYAPLVACRACRQAARCTVCTGPLGMSTATSTPTCGWCGHLAGDWRCANCGSDELRLVTIGAGRTAEELGRAFPGVQVVLADGERHVQEVDAEARLVVATRGAEPVAAGGYRAILLLDGERMLARESLRVGEDVLRQWSNAAALAAPRAPVMLVGVGGQVARALATWQQPRYAREELLERRALRFPPAVRAASVEGLPDAVGQAVERLAGIEGVDVLGPVPTEQGRVRAIVRLDYASGPDTARELRAAVVRNASSRRKPVAGRTGFRPTVPLRVRFDDTGLF
ncbi:primosomal protein N' [Clavibacter nebraskensis]|uniref:Probable replication restart protein PriA n=1 Tax=Clavibacter nebraskensis TaxID=31963 RepID=A0ABY4MMA0_9MICO|nr:primosomal protein N' [Clavibacter nebraskensis]QGV68109.1 primosomal protein N' [Clavibacter nebraskensis]QGV70899.1 primosomal protein N' [Clavibacter nebraskensis]QGV73692.1 primosomal protein N' [Clavibacter nebraskensis]UKF26899.1 primosomal protein N' [Clavibacter nebraskensis]UQB03959.1 primosomal protein N' [Clavibacter nebraskensis]